MNKQQFEQLCQQGYSHIPVYKNLLADNFTPVGVYASLQHYPFVYLFESVQGGERWGRYSMVGVGELTSLEFNKNKLTLTEGGQVKTTTCEAPFDYISEYLKQYKVPSQQQIAGLPGFTGGLVGYFAHDSIRYIEKKLSNTPQNDPIGLPDIWLSLSQIVVVFDNLKDTLSIVVHVPVNMPNGFEWAQSQIAQIEQSMSNKVQLVAKLHTPPVFVSQTGEAQYKQTVQAIQEYIKAGDVMQVVPSQRMTTDFDGEALSVYRALRHLNPSPYLYLLQGKTAAGSVFQLVGSSPEILSRLEDGKVTVRPLAGTRPRGATKQQDLELEQDLLNDSKEIAEHLMLIDLGRNDVGRVSKIGSVQVTEKMQIERYSHVMHIVSNVEGEVLPDKTAMDVFKATFPAGTLTGAPKIRAMEIIDEFEPVKRGVFGGAIGYLGWHGEMDTAIAIRTAIIKDGKLHVQAGAGVVADSIAQNEWDETCNKAKAVIKAVELSANGLKL